MLPNWFAFVQKFIGAQWVPIVCVVVALVAWEFTRRKLKKAEKRLAGYDEDAYTVLARRDAYLVDAAKKRINPEDVSRASFIEIIGFRLDFLSRKFKRAQALSRRLGIAALCASSMSSFITGSQFFGGLTIGLSFTVTSVGAVALAIVTFINADADAVHNLVLAERIRNELAEYIGSADSYTGLTPEDAYNLFAKTVNKLFVENIAIQETEARAKIAAANAADTKDGGADA